MQSGRALFLGLVLTLLPGLAGAATISVSWTGTVDYVAPELASAFAIGDPASGSFQIDTTIADTDSDPMVGFYPGAASAIVFRFGGYDASADSGAVGTSDALGDYIGVGVQSLGGEVQGIPVETLSFLIQSGPGWFSTDAIPASLDPTAFHGDAQAYMGPGSSQRLLGATVSSFSYAVPEPGTGTLLALGLPLLGRAPRRSHPGRRRA